MKRFANILINLSATVFIMLLCFGAGFLLQKNAATDSMLTAVFVLGAFLTSLVTVDYIYGIVFSLGSVVMVNFAFTFPYFQVNFTIPENLTAAIIMLVVATVTCTLTTKLKRQEAIKARGERERMRADLLRAVSHDLRTPLTTIYGASSAMLENSSEFTDEQKTKMLIGIKEDAQWLTQLVENLLSITRLDGQNVNILKTATVLDEFIDAVLIKFQKRYPKQEVTVELPEDFTVIPMDAMLIEQVIINILENAVQHATGMTQLSMKVFSIGDKAVFEIRDNGCGISPERLKYIFDGYFHEEHVPSDSHRSNAGIGLSVCSAIIKAHGGHIQAQNRKNGGILFRFTLDMEVQSNEQQV